MTKVVIECFIARSQARSHCHRSKVKYIFTTHMDHSSHSQICYCPVLLHLHFPVHYF